MVNQCQEQEKDDKALLRQVKAADRELRRQQERARVQRRHVKQRQVSRARGRTHKIASCWYEEESCGDRQIVFYKIRCKWWEEDIRGECGRGDPWLDIDKQGWKVVASYCVKHRSRSKWDDDNDDGMDDSPSSGEGRFLAYNIYRREVLLSGYASNRGCSTCGQGDNGTEAAVMDILEQPSGVSTEKPFVASAACFLRCAQLLVDPAMTLRRAMPEDVGYESLVTLYAMYTLFYSRVLCRVSRGHLSHRRQHLDKSVVADWTPIEWTPSRYNGVVRLQAMWRGWVFRHRVLYSPHTELGRRYLLRAWRRDCCSHNSEGQLLMEWMMDGQGRP